MAAKDLGGFTGNEIAIIGMGGRFPGARSLEQFWQNLRDGVESVRVLSDAELRSAGISDSDLRNPQYVKAAPVLDEVGWWDASFWGFSPKDAAIMDPQHRLFLEVSWEALERAGVVPATFPGAIGVFAGAGMHSYFTHHLAPNHQLMDSVGHFLVRHTGNDKDFLSTRVSYCLNLRGPSINVQTACSTSLVAIHLAVQSLLSGECDLALAGGVTIELPQGVGYLFKENEILSPDGHCRAFDAQSRGTLFGSGAGIVVLRRLQDALDAGDQVEAIIIGTAVNNDGSSKVGYLAPSVDGQAACVAEALSIAAVPADSIGYVEMHGTGTPVGDPIEVAALTQAFRSVGAQKTQAIPIGSLKTNIGHLDTAAGVAGVIKTALALKHHAVPPSLHYSAPNPIIDFESSPFYVNATLSPWVSGAVPRRAGISSLGVGGTNAHIVVQEAPPRLPSAPSARQWQLLPVSAKTVDGVERAMANLADHFREHADEALADVAWTLQTGRNGFAERRAVVVRSGEEAIAALDGFDAKASPTGSAPPVEREVAFLFAGGGAQFASMGASLFAHESVYRESVAKCAELLRPMLDRDLFSLLYPTGGRSAESDALLERPAYALPALFTTQYAFSELLASWGIRPAAMIGHSMGEYTAACLAGVFSLADALHLVALRGQLFESLPTGGMLAVPMSVEELSPLLGASLSIAAINGPQLCVASGPVAAIDALEATLAARDVEARRVRIEVAAHSSMLEPILVEFGAFLSTIKMAAPQLPFVSNLSGTWITSAEATDPQYWVQHLRQTVRFSEGIQRLFEDADRILLEVGPGRTLATLASLHPSRPATQPVLQSMRHPDDTTDDVAFALGVAGRLWANGAKIDWQGLHGGAARQKLVLPTYPWDRAYYWFDRPVASDAPAPTSARRTDVQDFASLASWGRSAAVRSAVPDGTSVIFADVGSLGDRLAGYLRNAGHSVVTVRSGDHFGGAGDAWHIRPDAADDAEALLGALRASGISATRLVHAWSLAPADPSAPIKERLSRAFDSVFALSQALAKDDVSSPLTVDVLTVGAWGVAGEPVLDPARATAFPSAATLAAEVPIVHARGIDVVWPSSPEDEARTFRAIAAELATPVVDTVVALRGTDRWTPQWNAAPLLRDPAAPVRLRAGGVYLVTGGLGGIGLSLAEGLATATRGTIVLVGRGGLPARDQWPSWLASHGAADEISRRIGSIQAMEGLGATVVVVAADVTNSARMTELFIQIRREHGAVHGIVHAAGTLDDGLLALKSRASAADVIAPKVLGTLALDQAVGDAPIDFFVCCSSVSSVASLPGQADYASANAFLDAFCEARTRRTGEAAIAIGWSAWRDVGMAAALARGDSAAPVATGHPVLSTQLAGAGTESLFSGTLATATHWVLDEHRVRAGTSLLPGTGYLELARAAVASRPDARPVELRDVAFLAPFVVQDTAPRELRLTLKRGGGGFSIAGRLAEGGWEEHVTGEASYSDAAVPSALDIGAIAARCPRIIGYTGAEEHPQLAFGPRWKNIAQIAYGDAEALMTLQLPERFAADLAQWPMHPALLDMATAGAVALIPDIDPTRDFYVPMSYGKVQIFGALPARIMSHIRRRETEFDPREIVAFDVTVVDPDGRVLVEISEFLMTRLADGAAFGSESRRSGARRDDGRFEPTAAHASREPVGYDEALTPAEGVEVFLRLIETAMAPHVLITPRTVASQLAQLRAAAQPAVSSMPMTAKPTLALDEVEAVLAANPAVRQAVALARADRAGSVRLVAYYVEDADHRSTVSDLRRFLKQRLPERMVPGTFVALDALPLRADGAVDRAALPDPFSATDDFVAPRTDMERSVADTWREVLGVEKIGIYDNFFDIGGHSLLAVRVITRLDKRLSVKINNAMMVLQTLEQIAAECDRQKSGPSAVPEVGLQVEMTNSDAASPGLAGRLFKAFGRKS